MDYSAYIKEYFNKKMKNKYTIFPYPRSTSIRVACILDEFSYESFKYEGYFYQLTPYNWKYIIDNYSPSFLFVEAAWEGVEGLWKYKIANYSKNKDDSLGKIVDYCMAKGIPTVFWAKEDPYDFNIFINAASLFQYVFTTDDGSIPRYKELLAHNNIDLLQFAAQPLIHNPVDKGRERKGQLIFPGGWYSKFPERCKAIEILLDEAMKYDLKIYNRFYKSKDIKNKFPDKYSRFILDGLSYLDLIKEIKKFDLLLNTNSVDDSNTNFSRRVFEALSCGLPIFSSYALGIDNYFGDIVQMGRDRIEVKEKLKKFVSSREELDKRSLLGIREVLKKHTYSHRMKYILDKLSIENSLLQKEGVSIITSTNRPHCLDNILKNYLDQNYQVKELIIVINNDNIDLLEWRKLIGNRDDISLLKLNEDHTLGECLNHAIKHSRYEYISKFDDDDYYGANYLVDIINAFKYTDASIVGKHTIYTYMEDTKELLLRFPYREHRYMDYVAGSTLTFKKEIFNDIQFTHQNRSEDTLFLTQARDLGYKIYSSDRFNHIVTRRKNLNTHTWKISDVEFRKNCIPISKGIDFDNIVFK